MIDDTIIEEVWNKGIIIDGFDKNLIRKDSCGAWILRSEYGHRSNNFGWVIDHVYPTSMGGGDDIANIRPMQWENNEKKGDDYPVYLTSVHAEGNENINKEGQFTVNAVLQEILSKLYNIHP